MKLLLIDDDAFLRDMYATKFSASGYEVKVADGPVVGLHIIEDNPDLDIILMDMIMPGMTGVELLQEIHKKLPDLKAKCIVLSNQGEASDIKAATEAGAVGYIVKADTVPSEVVKKVEEFAKK